MHNIYIVGIRVKEGKHSGSETCYVVSVCCWSEKVKGNPLGETPKTETSSGPLLPTDNGLIKVLVVLVDAQSKRRKKTQPLIKTHPPPPTVCLLVSVCVCA